MRLAKTFLWAAAMVACAALVPRPAEIVGMHLAGQLWDKLYLQLPLLSQAGELIAGAITGALIGIVQWLLKRELRARWIGASAVGGAAVGLVYGIYAPLAIVAAPAAAGLVARRERFARAQSVAAAWAAFALALPFPPWVRGAFLVAAGVLSAFSAPRA